MKSKKYIIIAIILIIVLVLLVLFIKFDIFKNIIENEEHNENNQNLNTEIEEKKDIWDAKNVTINIDKESVTKKGANIEIVDKNTSLATWKMSFELQVLQNDKWEYLMQKAEVNWVDTDYLPNDEGITKIYCDWIYMYGELKSGTYRIVKDNYPNSIDKIYSETFIIE